VVVVVPPPPPPLLLLGLADEEAEDQDAGSTRMAQAAGDQGRLADLARELTDN